jgi:hypothetical protein
MACGSIGYSERNLRGEPLPELNNQIQRISY